MKTYVVLYEIDESGWWVASVPSVQGCQTQGRSIDEAKARIREALSLFLDDADKVQLKDKVQLPAGARQLIRIRDRKQRELETHSRQAQQATKTAIDKLQKSFHLGVRDIGRLLNLSYQRVQQIAAKSKSEVVSRKSGSARAAKSMGRAGTAKRSSSSARSRASGSKRAIASAQTDPVTG
jgi:predicted RNase H-like HicB family nuclease